ncbi:MAG: hypothetical protein WD176_09780, partial [Pirellulales bacterium]
FFLFKGDEPLDLTLYAPSPRRFTVSVRGRPRQHERLMRQWWRNYNAAAAEQAERSDYPPLVDHYIVSMLSSRLRLDPTPAGRKLLAPEAGQEGLDLLIATDTARLRLIDQLMREGADSRRADRPLPDPPSGKSQQPPVPKDAGPKGVEIEPIAMHVPEECYYLRFGSFANYRWFRVLLEDYAGDLRNLIAGRGFDFELNQRFEKRLGIKDTTLGKIFGGKVISDMAIIGMDTFFREGAAFGMMFHASNTKALGGDLMAQRDEAATARGDVRKTTEKIAGHVVSFYSSPDGVMRSFYAADGDFHLVTSSRTLMRRFLEAGEGRGALGATAGFRHSRSIMPLKRGDTVFAHISAAHLRNLASPQYRVEMSRRMRSVVEIDLWRLAHLAASAEGRPAGTIDDLIEGRFLPRGFGVRPDGSELVIEPSAAKVAKNDPASVVLVDSRRGRAGAFVPVADVEVTSLSPREEEEYLKFRDYVESKLGVLGPVMAGITRKPGEKGIENISIDARVSPFTGPLAQKLVQLAAPATREAIAPIETDLISGQVVLRGDDGEPRLLFAGLSDFRGTPTLSRGKLMNWLALAQNAVGYVGSWPEAGPLAKLFRFDGDLPPGETTHIDVFGGLGLFVTKSGEFTVLSLNRDDLDTAAEQLRVIEADEPAQFRLRVEDLTETRLGDAVNQLSYTRSRDAS